MPSDNRPRRIAVLGTGISSVGALASLSHHATTNPELNLTVDIFEKDGRPGGHTATVFLESKEKCDAYFASNSHSAKSNGTPSSKQPVHIATEHSTPLATFARTTPTQHPVDTGFIVMNPVTYPNMLAFLSHLNVPTAPSDMSFAVSRRSPSAPLKPELEWAGKSLGTVFCDWQNLYTGFFGIWRMIYDMTKFQTEAENMVRAVEAKRFDDEGRFVGNKVQDAGEGMSLVRCPLVPLIAGIHADGSIFI